MKTTTSRLALAVIASAFATSAMAADLGGNCCADLEERVSELEATAARKGNRKVSLTVYGQVNEAIMWFDDGNYRGQRIVDNNNSRSRFGFKGEGKINADLSAGYLIEIGVRRNDSNNVTQATERTGTGLDIRHDAAYIQSKTYGTVWLGWTSSATDGITEVDLGATAASAFDRSPYLGKFTANGLTQPITWNQLASRTDQNWSDDDARRGLIKYISPLIAGFQLQTSVGNNNDFWDIALRYAGEAAGFRVAAGIGYWAARGELDPNFASGGQTTNTGGCWSSTSNTGVDCNSLGLSGSVMHIQTGLFLSGAYSRTRDKGLTNFLPAADGTDDHWIVRAGIQKNWFGLGATTLYGDYSDYQKGSYLYRTAAPGAFTFSTTGSEVKAWSIGVNQTIDAAATDLYLFYQRNQGDATICTTAVLTGCTGQSASDLSMVVGGMLIKF